MGTHEACLLGNGKSTLKMWIEMLGQEIRNDGKPTNQKVSKPKGGK